MTRTAIVTGGAQGIGRGCAEHFLQVGWHVAALDKNAEALAKICESQPGDRLLCVSCDVGDESAVKKAFAAIADWRSAPLALLVNNAGIADPYSGPVEDLALKDWQRWIDASLTAAFLCTRAAVPQLRQAQGAIVNIASTRAVMSEPDSEAYAAAKSGLVALTHALAISLGPDIRVNAIQPGWIETGPWQKAAQRKQPDHRDVDRTQHPVGRVGEVRDITAAVAYLASEDAGFVTGQVLTIDGGMTRKMIYAH